jgi:lipopolysaccharide export system permease protein
LIIDRYLTREITGPLLTVCTILVVIFISYNAARYTADAAAGLLPASTVIYLTFLRSIIALETLLPVALYLSVVVGLGRLYTDHEMNALNAAGVSEFRVLRTVFMVSLVVATVVAVLSTTVRPWAYHNSYLLKAKAEAEFNVDKLEAGRFYASEESENVMFVEKVQRRKKRMEKVFFQSEHEDRSHVVFAQEAYQPVTDPFAAPVLIFNQGHAYQIDRTGNRDISLAFNQLTLYLEGPEAKRTRYKSKSAPTGTLINSNKPKDSAELQWRLTTPLSTLLLGLVAVPLSRAAPRRGRYAKTVAAAVLYALYYNLSVLAKSWMEQGVVGAAPGLWWPDILLAIVLLTLVFKPNCLQWAGRT